MQGQCNGKHPGASYLDLIRAFPMRPIRGNSELERANAILLKLATRPQGLLRRDEQDYLATLAMLVRQAEGLVRRRLLTGLMPAQVVRHLMDERGMNITELGKIVGNQSTASMILHGRRDISKMVMVRLARYFGVSPVLFLNPADFKAAAMSA